MKATADESNQEKRSCDKEGLSLKAKTERFPIKLRNETLLSVETPLLITNHTNCKS